MSNAFETLLSFESEDYRRRRNKISSMKAESFVSRPQTIGTINSMATRHFMTAFEENLISECPGRLDDSVGNWNRSDTDLIGLVGRKEPGGASFTILYSGLYSRNRFLGHSPLQRHR